MHLFNQMTLAFNRLWCGFCMDGMKTCTHTCTQDWTPLVYTNPGKWWLIWLRLLIGQLVVVQLVVVQTPLLGN